MMKKMTKWLPLTAFALVLAACGGGTSSSASSANSTPTSSTAPSSSEAILNSITIAGAADASIEFNVPFNLFTGVTATGDNGIDYTASLTISSISTAVNTTTGDLDTTKTGVHVVRYLVKVGSVERSQFRNVTVESPESTGMLVNPDFSLGTAGWSEPENGYFQAEGGSFTSFDVVNGELKMDVIASSIPVFPRFGQQNIPFEQGKSYEVSFDARSSVEREIALQVGELLPAAPWFNDFIPVQQFFYRNITTTMTRHSYKFTMTQDNQKGGILFGLGTVNGQRINATLYFDNISIVETTIGEDEEAPVFQGVRAQVNTNVGSTFDPLLNISAIDAVDGDLTDEIVVQILDESSAVVSEVDTTQVGSFTINYSVEDAAGNEATAVSQVNVIEPVTTSGYSLPQWRTFTNSWEGSAASHEGVDGELVMTLGNANFYANWNLQIIQDNFAPHFGGTVDNEGHMQLVAGKTYRVSFDARSSIAGAINLAIGTGVGGWVPYEVKELNVTTEMQTITHEFTLDAAGNFTAPAQFKIEMGTLFTAAPAGSTFILDNVIIEEKVEAAYVATELIVNGTMGKELE